MARPALPEERGHDERPDPPTLSELKAAHDWTTEECTDGGFIIDQCAQCGHEESAGTRGRTADCPVRKVPQRLLATARRYDLLPDARASDEQTGRANDGLLLTSIDEHIGTPTDGAGQ